MTAAIVVVATLFTAAPSGPPTAEVLKELRKIESAGYRQTSGELRLGYTKQAQQRPGDPTLRVYIAWCDYPSDDSWNQFKAITQQFPDNNWAHLGMGLVYAKWKMKQQAQAEYDGILSRDAKFYPAITATADLLLANGDAAGAEKKYREALAIADDAGAHAGLGRLLLSQGKKEQAVPELEKAVAQWPDQPAVLRALLTLELEEKRTAKAVEVASRIAELAPRDREIRKTLADLRYEQGDQAAAAQEYERLLRLGNPEAPVLARLAELYKGLDKPDDEQRTLQLLAAMDRTNPAPNIRIAELSMAKDATEAAEGQLAEALERDPKNVTAHLMAGKLKQKKGVLHEALEPFRPAGRAGQAQAAELEKKIEMPKKPAKGSVDAIYGAVAKDLGEFLVQRQKANPKLAGGILKYRVKVLADGQIEGVEVIDDTVGDPLLTAHVYFGLKEATFPKQRREPVFEFEVAGKKGKK
jgi:Tfp pilus assembly protein PilF